MRTAGGPVRWSRHVGRTHEWMGGWVGEAFVPRRVASSGVARPRAGLDAQPVKHLGAHCISRGGKNSNILVAGGWLLVTDQITRGCCLLVRCAER